MKKLLTLATVSLTIFLKVDAKDQSLEDLRKKEFSSLSKRQTTALDVFAEKLNILLLLEPSAIKDEVCTEILNELNEDAARISYYSSQDKLECMIIINEADFREMTIEERRGLIKKLYYLTFGLAKKSLSLITESKFKALFLTVNEFSLICEWENGSPKYSEEFMRK